MFSIGEFAQAGKLLNGITVEELRGMLALRRAQLEQELKEYTTRLREVEARLDYIEGENAMPADDIMVKKIPAMGVVASRAPPPARYLVLPAIEAATAVRSGPASSIYPTPVHPPRSYTGLAAPWKIKSSKPSYRTVAWFPPALAERRSVCCSSLRPRPNLASLPGLRSC